MSIQALINRPCTITHRSPGEEADVYGNKVPTEETTETVCELQQQGASSFRSESEDEVSDTRWVAYFLPGTAVEAADTLTVDGEHFELFGDPWAARNPRTGVISHIEAPLRRTAALGENS